ncbi:GreA/GreB family elongation factor [Pseudalkalibacillus salsuginis]|uniref:GreA/GreB family elongation factor n=1 Tax=Pseudalkalibacillus salsuginis TaxID=2910972 RepID=UPI001F37D4E2|nr:GreA/GreB family elongation factor [Pseudalkalibacillus salsuginis]MCF6411890.1 GreA/GreB family elongation factor [Pseudalkalibacillus salsuginis]
MSKERTRLTSEGIKMLATELIDVYEGRKTPFGNASSMNEEEERFYKQRITDLEQLLYSAEPIPENKMSETVTLGSMVTLFDPFLDEIETYKLVHPVEASPLRKYISVESILGRELLLRKKGDDVRITLYGDTIRYNILDVK